MAAATGRNYYRGNLALHCRYQDFTIDTALNRILTAAARVIVADDTLPWDLRRRARASTTFLQDATSLRPADFHAMTDRRTAHYRPALQLARHIISYTSRTLEAGSHTVKTFLFRTPDLIEDGIRTILRHGLAPGIAVEKETRVAGVSFSPDLVFNDGQAAGDVKYKLSDGTWSRSDLYQAIAFAVAFNTHHAIVIGFSTTDSAGLPDATPGRYRIRYITWRAKEGEDATHARNDLLLTTREWYDSRTVMPTGIAGGSPRP